MKKQTLLIMLLSLLVLSNIATYFYARSSFFSPSPPAAELPGESSGDELLREIRYILEEKYFQPPDEEKMLQGAINGMISSLGDPYTAYLNTEAMEDLLIQATGVFSGIGVEITEDEGEILILRVIDDTPASRAGVRQGDRILEVEGISLFSMAIEEVARLLRGPDGTEVNFTLSRPEERELLNMTLTRAQIERDTVFPRRLESGLGYIQVTNFDQGTAKSFRNALTTLEDEGIEGLIIDFRDNPGGLLDEAVEMGEFIVPRGEITRVVDRDGNVLNRYLSQAKPRGYPIVLLVNRYTASAAEIVSGALQDSGKAVLVGTTTFGKASVQYLQYLSGGDGLRYTVARYLTPAGRDIHRIGLAPDYNIELPAEYYLQNRSVPRDIYPGDTGEKILLLQTMLGFLGYPSDVTGVSDEKLFIALDAFRSDHGLPPGSLDDPAREALRKALSIKCAEADEQLNYAIELLLIKN